MKPLEVAQMYFDAWNRRDAAGLVATFADGGTYVDPASGGELKGEAIGNYAAGLWRAFPDLKFDVASAGECGDSLVAAQWVMRGVNSGSFAGLPPTGRSVELAGADFVRVEGDKVRSVRGYFDSRGVPEQLGIKVLVQPESLGPFTFGSSTRVQTGKRTKPGAFSITMLQARSPEEAKKVTDYSPRIVSEMLAMPGFIGWLGVAVGSSMITVTAWEDANAPRQLVKQGAHMEAMRDFFGPEISSGGYTSVWVPERFNATWVRCGACARMVDHEKSAGRCVCGEMLPEPAAYW
jgi:steroid delta-isomerase-like uncharacterized protein